jgi:hypothetical protein
MNWPLLPVMPELDELDGDVALDDVEPEGEVVLAPLDVLIDPFHEPRQPV